MISILRRSMPASSLLRLASEITDTIKDHLNDNNGFHRSVVSLTPHGRPKGNILISRNHRCFFLKPGEGLPTKHQSHWEVHQIATIFLNLGYSVDVIHYLNNGFTPQKDYSLFLDVKWNLERLDPLLNEDCAKVLHAKTAHPLFQAAAELTRLRDLQQRRGVTLQPWRQDPLNWAIEHADCGMFTGNDFTMSTYRYAQKPLYRIPCATPFLYPSPVTKNYEHCRSHFLFMAGVGMVHKGLDRVLEAFAAMPQLSLTVCGPVEKEHDFVRAYRRELYETENIHLVGWVDVASDVFQGIANNCVALLHPSCSEGGATSVVTCMHAGLIPIASVESGVDIRSEFGILLQNSSIQEIQDAVHRIATCSSAALRGMAQSAWQEAREFHSCEKFTEDYTRLVSRILSAGSLPRPSWEAANAASS